MRKDIVRLIEQIAKLPEEWHGAGSVSPRALRAIALHAEGIGGIRYSVETGSGKTTLLLSHLSAHHTVFALDEGRSVGQVKNSPLFAAENVTYVEGPTQRTLPQHDFTEPLQFALIDGPHGYPFPDLEYFYFYPRVEAGGLLLVDDIKIPSIGRMYDIIRADDMFELIETVDDNMVIFRRTEAPCINPESDSWWLQGYNRPYYQQISSPATPKALLDRLKPKVGPIAALLGKIRGDRHRR